MLQNPRINDSYPAFVEAPILLPQPLPATGAPLSRADQVRRAARARNTVRAYYGHWGRFRCWAREQGLDLPEEMEAALCDYLVHLAEEGRRMATIRQARAAIVKGAQLRKWPRPEGSNVAETMLGLGHLLKGPQKQAAPLHAEALAAIRATALTPRRTRGGHTETAEYARRRGLQRVSEAAPCAGGTWTWRGTAAAAYGFLSRRRTRRPRARCYTWDRLPSRPCRPSAPKRR